MNTKRNNFAPSIECLEDRCLLSVSPLLAPPLTSPRTSPVAIQVGSTLAPPVALPRTGGVAIQVGSTLELGVAPAGMRCRLRRFWVLPRLWKTASETWRSLWTAGRSITLRASLVSALLATSPVNEVLLIS